MGGCISSPNDLRKEITDINSANGSDEASLIYSGHMSLSSKISVLFISVLVS